MRVEAWHDNDDILGSQVGRILLLGETNASFIPPHPIRRPPNDLSQADTAMAGGASKHYVGVLGSGLGDRFDPPLLA